MKILIVGGGNMGQTYARSILRSQISDKANLMILEKSQEKAKVLREEDIGEVYGTASICVPSADLIILAVKPQDTLQLFPNLKSHIDPNQVILSIMAGITIDTMCKELGSDKIIRAMPNLPAQVGMGMTVFTSTEAVTRLELVMVQNLINTTGKSIYVEKEKAIDSSTAISGSGPAYVFFFMQSMMDSALKLGFSKSEAELLVSQTFRGTIDLYRKANFNCDEWIDKVSSRGGTTEAAIRSFREDVLDKKISYGIEQAYDRAVELGLTKTP